MVITKHGTLRFKQRLKVKNEGEMKRRVNRAISRGRHIKNISNNKDTTCYLYDNTCYIVNAENKILVTVYKQLKNNHLNKRAKIENIKTKEFYNELAYGCCGY